MTVATRFGITPSTACSTVSERRVFSALIVRKDIEVNQAIQGEHSQETKLICIIFMDKAHNNIFQSKSVHRNTFQASTEKQERKYLY